jgi:HK97 family phage portal protein
MKLFGFEINRITKATDSSQLLPPSNYPGGISGWFNVIRESFPGAWQRNVDLRLHNVLTYSTLYACVTLIASDIGKLGLRLVEEDDDSDIWHEIEVPAFSPVIDKPNHYQTRQKFIEQWITSKLIHGNAYILKERDNRRVVTKLYVLDPQVTRPLIAPDGAIYYQLATNRLAGIDGLIGIDLTEVTKNTSVTIPASEIIHDVNVPLYHPLCGVSPISACGLAAVQGLTIQNNSNTFFANGSRPGGVLSAPGLISDPVAARLKEYWEQNYSGDNAGKVAVLGDGLKYEAMSINAQDAQLISQLKWTSEQICTAFHIPPWIVGVGPMPGYSNVEAMNQQYYSQCLQALIEAIEVLLDEGLGLKDAGYGVEFDLDDLLKMDTATQVRTYGDGIVRGLMSPNEGRRKLNLPPVDGGDTPYLQQQNYSLAALDKRDTQENPFPAAKPPQLALPKPAAPEEADGPPPRALPVPSNDWSLERCLKGFNDAGA